MPLLVASRKPGLRQCTQRTLPAAAGCKCCSPAPLWSSRDRMLQVEDNTPCSRQSAEDISPCTASTSGKEESHSHHLPLLAAAGAALLQAAPAALAAEEAEQAYAAAVANYQPSPYTPGWEVWFGAVVATIPFVLGAWEFTKRIIIQQRCEVCEGRGLVMKGNFPKKCPQCGGFFPWVSWRYFFLSTAAPGNGGPLLQPKGQTGVFYKVPPAPVKPQAQQEQVEQEQTAREPRSKEANSSKD